MSDSDPSALPVDKWHINLGDYMVSMATRPVGELNPRELGIAHWMSPDTMVGAVANLVLGPDGSVGVSQIIIGAAQQDNPLRMITSSTLREIPIGTVLAQATRAFLEAKQDLPLQPILQQVQTEEFKKTLEGETPTLPKKPQKLTDDLLKTVALLYLEEYGGGRGMQKRMAARLQGQLGEPVLETQVRDWISAARRRGWLTTGQAGRRSAGPGWKLVEAQGGTQPGVKHPGVTTEEFLAKLPGTKEYLDAQPGPKQGERSASEDADAIPE